MPLCPPLCALVLVWMCVCLPLFHRLKGSTSWRTGPVLQLDVSTDSKLLAAVSADNQLTYIKSVASLTQPILM
jgi:hypothetical protein